MIIIYMTRFLIAIIYLSISFKLSLSQRLGYFGKFIKIMYANKIADNKMRIIIIYNYLSLFNLKMMIEKVKCHS